MTVCYVPCSEYTGEAPLPLQYEWPLQLGWGQETAGDKEGDTLDTLDRGS